MLVRTHTANGVFSKVTYSDCEAYRYRLSRRWADSGGMVNFVMLNPSVADEYANDPTVERCERRARMLGFGGLEVTNIFAWRDTDPMAMRKASEPVGMDNDKVLIDTARTARMVIAAWGVHGAHLDRGETVRGLLESQHIPLQHLGLSKQGHPRHPLYVPYVRRPTLWKADRGN